MDEGPKNRLPLVSTILIVVVVVVIIWLGIKSSQTPAWNSYHEKTYGFDVKYPQAWQIADSMIKDGCCLFIVNVNISTTTTMNASGTPIVSVTATEPIKIQLGHYYRNSAFDPFKMATNTPITLGKNASYTGVSSGIPFYLIPMSSEDGIGAAYFTALDNTDTAGTRQIVEKVLSTISFTGTSTPIMDTKNSSSTNTN